MTVANEQESCASQCTEADGLRTLLPIRRRPPCCVALPDRIIDAFGFLCARHTRRHASTWEKCSPPLSSSTPRRYRSPDGLTWPIDDVISMITLDPQPFCYVMGLACDSRSDTASYEEKPLCADI